jgi:hypothetical protein
MWPHILSSKFLNNLAFEIYNKNWRSDLLCCCRLKNTSLPVDVVWDSHLKKYVNAKHLYKNLIIVDAAYFSFHRTVETFFRDTYAPWKSNTNGMALISNPLPAPRSRMGGAIILPSFFACFGMLQGDLYLYRKWNTLCFTQHFFLAHCPDLYERTHITGLESHFSEHERMMQDTSELPSVTEFLFLHARYDDLTWAVFRKWDNGRCNNKSMWNTLFLCTEIY